MRLINGQMVTTLCRSGALLSRACPIGSGLVSVWNAAAARTDYHLTLGLKGLKGDRNMNEAKRGESSLALVQEQPLHIE